MSTTTVCDNCGKPLVEHYSRYSLEYDGPKSVEDPLHGWDFCSVDCIQSWAADR